MPGGRPHWPCFNEAACRDTRKYGDEAIFQCLNETSFNEAACRDTRKSKNPTLFQVWGASFNEAACRDTRK